MKRQCLDRRANAAVGSSGPAVVLTVAMRAQGRKQLNEIIGLAQTPNAAASLQRRSIVPATLITRSASRDREALAAELPSANRRPTVRCRAERESNVSFSVRALRRAHSHRVAL